MMIDTHCHLDYVTYDNLDEIVSKLDYIVISGANQKMNEEVIDIINKYENVYGVIGYHPDDFLEYDEAWLEKNINNPKIVGIGEIGLDYYHNKDNIEKQKEMFIKQINLAKKHELPIVIHSRDAAMDTKIILEENLEEHVAILHCYSYSYEMAKEFTKKNIYLGIGGVLTFKNSHKLKEVVDKINLDKLVLETDSPYLTPEPYRGKTNEPYNVYYVAKEISKIKNITLEEVLNSTSFNALKIFKKIKTN